MTAVRPTSLLAANFRSPTVRHLAWLCQTPQLINNPLTFRPQPWLPDRMLQTLQAWDAAPDQGPAVLTQTPHYRLGLYVERLYDCLMRDILGWAVVARNLPIRAQGRTLGELDFVVRNPHTNQNEHHEIAVKFYLGYAATGATGIRWYGPNARDRLDIKAHRLLHHQSQRCQLPQTLNTLAAAGIAAPTVSRIFVPGYLFYPVDTEMPAPSCADTDHLRGHWMTLPDARRRDDTECWVVLRKPHWLGPWSQPETPDRQAVLAGFAEIADSDTPRLFAAMRRQSTTGQWQETMRFFVVPVSWPGGG